VTSGEGGRMNQRMRDIVVFGPGCPRCEQLAANAEAAARALGIDSDIFKITDAKSFSAFGVTATPALMVDNRVLASGKVPTVDEIKAMLR